MMSMTSIRTRHRGFSLIELLAVMAVLGVLGVMVTPLWQLLEQRQREQELRHALWEIRGAIDRYRTSVELGEIEGGASGYPATLSALVEGRPHLKRLGERVYFLRRVPRDPLSPVGVSAELSWGLRSYSSPADRPAPGADVFDVYSKAPGVGLNGVSYREW